MSSAPFFEDIPFKTWSQVKQFAASMGGSSWAFRGMQRASWDLQSSIERSDSIDPKRDEAALVRYFRRRAPVHLPGHLVPHSTFGWLALMQHYGAPTRLVDFTASPYAGLFFALERRNENPAEPHAVWAIDRSDLFLHAMREYSEQMGMALEDARTLLLMRQDLLVDSFLYVSKDSDRAFRGVVAVEPELFDARQAAQQALFLCPADLSVSFMTNMERLALPRSGIRKLTIPASLRTEALTDLREMNVTAASLYPGLDGMARSLHIQLTLEAPTMRAFRNLVAQAEVGSEVFSSQPDEAAPKEPN